MQQGLYVIEWQLAGANKVLTLDVNDLSGQLKQLDQASRTANSMGCGTPEVYGNGASCRTDVVGQRLLDATLASPTPSSAHRDCKPYAGKPRPVRVVLTSPDVKYRAFKERAVLTRLSSHLDDDPTPYFAAKSRISQFWLPVDYSPSPSQVRS